MSKSRGDCGIYDQRPGRQTDPQNMPTYLCPVGFSQSWMCTYVHKHIQGLLEPTRKQGSVFYKHLILKCLWNGCSGAAMGKNCRKMKRGPFLNWIAFPWLQSISESWFFCFVFWQACLACCSWQARPYRCVLGFRPRSRCLLPLEATPERGKKIGSNLVHWV